MYAYEQALSDEEVPVMVCKQLGHYQAYGFGLCAVVLKATGAKIDQCGLTMQDGNEREVLEIGYLLQKAFFYTKVCPESRTRL